MTEACVYIGLGSNIEPESNIPRALELLARGLRLTALSTFYRTEPVGPPGQPFFFNGVACGLTSRPPRPLKFEFLRAIEAQLGRQREAGGKYLPRSIDLDILVYGDLAVREPDLVIPDPDLDRRPFLAAALLELAPDLVLPGARTPLRLAQPGGMLEPLTEFSQRLRERFITSKL